MAAGLLLLALPLSASLETLVAEGNPHQQTCEGEAASCTSCPAQALSPELFLATPIALALPRQLDTFLRVDTHSHAGVPVPVFQFKQPARLSHLELPFGVALLMGVDERGLLQLPVPQAAATDSWFEGYAWTHVLMCSQEGAEGGLHLGWRYVRNPESPPSLGPEEFVALIVRPDKSAEQAGARGSKLPTAQELAVGIEAPAWMLAMAMATRVRSKAAK